jgi:hypothetical protein
MRGFDLDHWDFIDLISSTSNTKQEVQDYLQEENDVRIPRTSYSLMWERLEEQLGGGGSRTLGLSST